MKFSSARGFARWRGSLVAALALTATLGLVACEGDNGGPSGPDDTGGNGGQTGPTGPTGPSDVPINLGGDVGGVGTGAGLTAQQIADIGTLVATIDSATITDNKPVLEITVQTAHGGDVLGLAASTLRLGIAKLVPAGGGLPSRWQSYVNRAGTPSLQTPVLATAIQANAETGAAAGWTELGAGRYRYVSAVDLTAVTAPIAVPYEPNRTHRLSIALDLSGDARALAPDNPYVDFVPAGGSAGDKKIAATEKCAGCHVRFAEHGGPRRSVEYCVVCHNPGTVDPDTGESVDLAYMAHSIHRGEERTQGYAVVGFGGTPFDWSDVTYPQPISFCETCHEQSPATPQGDDWNVSVTASACGGCHDAGLQKTGPDPLTGRYAYSFKHPAIPSLPPDFVAEDGDCLGCHGPGRVAGETLAVHKQDEARKEIENGSLFTYEILNVENAAVGQSPKVTFQILDGNGAPVNVKEFTTDSRLRLDFAWSTQDIHNVADVAGGQYAVDRGEAIVADLIAEMASVVDNGNGTFSYTLSQPLPAGFADATLGTGLMVVLEGRRQMPDGTEAHPESAFRFAGGARTALVAQEKCESCHKRVAAHGGSRAGDPLICTVCHSSSLGGTFGTDVVGAAALGAMIHGLHASKLGEITYPQDVGRCEGCHLAGTFNVARTNALPLTVDAGTTEETGPAALSWTDDLADSATAGTCKSCHDSAEAIAHMQQQGGWFAQAKTLTPSSSIEGCAVCHGAGQTFDTTVEHCSRLPFGQCTTQ